MSAADTAAASAMPMTALRRTFILLTLTLVTMLYAMTVTIANVSLPQMQGSLAATQDQIAWVVTFNIVATAVATPMTGWFANRLGRRRTMIYAVIGFTVATLLCGLSGSVEELVLWRIFQGACGAPLVPLSQAIVVDTYPKHQHGPATAIWGMGVILGPIIAPVLGGYLSEAYNWRWVFFMVLPFAAVAFMGVWAFIGKRGAGARTRVRLDWTGFLALSVAIACLQLMLDRGERNDWFQSTEILLYAGLALSGLYVFVAHSLTAEKPFLNPKMLTDRNLVAGLVIAFLFGMLNFTPITLLPTLLQNLRGYPDSVIGYVLAWRGVGTLFGFFLMFFAGRLDQRIPIFVGFSMQAVAGYAMAQFDLNISMFDVAWTAAVQGFGVGVVWVSLSVVTFSTLDPKFVPDGTAVFHLLRNIGSSVHISLSVALVLRSRAVNYADMVPAVSEYNKSFDLPWVAGGWALDSPSSLAALSREITRQAGMIGYINAFYFFTATALAALPFILLIRRRKKQT